jgi:HEPN domain-containing protein
MALPKPAEARLFRQAAKQRFEDAQILLEAGRTTGAVYLAGYTVECYLKALILANVGVRLREQLLAEFHGSRGHNLQWLHELYRRHTGGNLPPAMIRHLSRLAPWSTDLRYATGSLQNREANAIMESVTAFNSWAEGRL